MQLRQLAPAQCRGCRHLMTKDSSILNRVLMDCGAVDQAAANGAVLASVLVRLAESGPCPHRIAISLSDSEPTFPKRHNANSYNQCIGQPNNKEEINMQGLFQLTELIGSEVNARPLHMATKAVNYFQPSAHEYLGKTIFYLNAGEKAAAAEEPSTFLAVFPDLVTAEIYSINNPRLDGTPAYVNPASIKSIAPQNGKVLVTFMDNTTVYLRPNPALPSD
jgi:hypothetical protein